MAIELNSCFNVSIFEGKSTCSKIAGQHMFNQDTARGISNLSATTSSFQHSYETKYFKQLFLQYRFHHLFFLFLRKVLFLNIFVLLCLWVVKVLSLYIYTYHNKIFLLKKQTHKVLSLCIKHIYESINI